MAFGPSRFLLLLRLFSIEIISTSCCTTYVSIKAIFHHQPTLVIDARPSSSQVMEVSPPPPPMSPLSISPPRTLTDLDEDSLAHCASFLDQGDVLNLALTCKHLRRVAYSDSVWSHLFRERWPYVFLDPIARVREAYMKRHASLQQFKFIDPMEIISPVARLPPSHVMLNRNEIFLAQGSSVQALKIDLSGLDLHASETYRSHSARITSMRLFPVRYTSLCRSDTHSQEMVLVTSSADHTIRLWWKGRSLRSFKGHNSPVTALGDRLLGGSNMKVLASGGEDGTIRLWSFSSSRQHNSVSVFHGHEKQISSLSVARHNPSLLASISKDAKIRVWDAAATSRSGSCVGMTSVSGQPLHIKCHEALCYVGAGSSATSIDLRTMQKVFSATIFPEKLNSFEVLPSKYLLCTGGSAKAKLWDIRFQRETESIADLEGHGGNVSMIHMDPYKIVTGGLHDPSLNVWETNTGVLANNLPCPPPDAEVGDLGLGGLAVDGQRIVTVCLGRSSSLIQYRDFHCASIPITSGRREFSSKFWEDYSQE